MVTALFQENLYQITGQAPVIDSAVDAQHEGRAKEIHDKQKSDDHNLSIKSDDDSVLASGRINPLGKAKRGSGVHGTKASRRLMEDQIFQQMLNDLDDLKALCEERDRVAKEIEDLESDLFTDEERAEFAKLPEDERYETEKRVLEEKLERGEITQAQYDKWIELQAKEKRIALDIARKREEFFELDKNASEEETLRKVAHDLHRIKEELVDQQQELADRIQGNDQFLNRLDDIKKTGDTSASNAELIVMLESRSDLGIQFPEDASFEDKIEMTQTAVEDQTIILKGKEVEIGGKVNKANDRLEVVDVMAADLDIEDYSKKQGVQVDVVDIEAASKQDGSADLFNQMSFANVKEEITAPEQRIGLAENKGLETPARELNNIDNGFSSS